MLAYSLLFIKKKLCSTGAFIETKTWHNQIKQRKKTCTKFDNLKSIFSKRIFPVQNGKNEHNYQILYSQIILDIELDLKLCQ